MKHKRIVRLDIRTGQPRITITRVTSDQPNKQREYTGTLSSFDRIVRVVTAHPHHGFHPEGQDRWVSVEA
jgi:hypothetical protein